MRRGGRNQGGNNFGRGILGSVPNVESGFGNVQPTSLLGPGMQTSNLLAPPGNSGLESLMGSRGILGNVQMGGVGALAGANLGASASLVQQELLARQQQALLLNSALQQQGLFNAQPGLIGNRPVGFDSGTTRLFGNNQLPSEPIGGRGLLGSGLVSSNPSSSYDDDYRSYDGRNREVRMNRMSDSDRAGRLGRNERHREIIQIKTERQSERTGGRGLEKRSVFPNDSIAKKEDLRDRLQEKGGKRRRSQDDEESNRRSNDGAFSCHACGVSCATLQEFDRHMNSAMHRERMGTIMDLHGFQTEQQMSRMKAQEHLRKIEQRRDDHCKICDKLMYGDPREHFNTSEHLRKERMTRRGCPLCKIPPWNTYSEYVAHVDTAAHHERKAEFQKEQKQKGIPQDKFVRDEKRGMSGRGGKFGRVDGGKAVGRQPPPVVGDRSGRPRSPLRRQEVLPSSAKQEPKTYDPEVAVGQECMKPVRGFLCNLCNVFAYSEAESRKHCRSEEHFQRFTERNVKSTVPSKTEDNVEQSQTADNEADDDGQNEVVREDVYTDDDDDKQNQDDNEVEIIMDQEEEEVMGQHEEEAEGQYEQAGDGEEQQGNDNELYGGAEWFEPEEAHEDDYNDAGNEEATAFVMEGVLGTDETEEDAA